MFDRDFLGDEILDRLAVLVHDEHVELMLLRPGVRGQRDQAAG